jgi:hypothetical protein
LAKRPQHERGEQPAADTQPGLRCDIGQGYFFAPPLDADAMRGLLNGDAAPPAAPEAPTASAIPAPRSY